MLCEQDAGKPTPGQAVRNQIGIIPVPGSSESLLLQSADSSPVANMAEQDVWKISELRRGITWLCPETSGQFLPQMLGYDQLGALNFKKGCYPGQEIVARTHYLGKVKRHPRLLCADAMICPNPLDKVEIISEDTSYTGIVTDCGHRPDGGTCLRVVTRMNPDLLAEKLDYQGNITALI